MKTTINRCVEVAEVDCKSANDLFSRGWRLIRTAEQGEKGIIYVLGRYVAVEVEN